MGRSRQGGGGRGGSVCGGGVFWGPSRKPPPPPNPASLSSLPGQWRAGGPAWGALLVPSHPRCCFPGVGVVGVRSKTHGACDQLGSKPPCALRASLPTKAFFLGLAVGNRWGGCRWLWVGSGYPPPRSLEKRVCSCPSSR